MKTDSLYLPGPWHRGQSVTSGSLPAATARTQPGLSGRLAPPAGRHAAASDATASPPSQGGDTEGVSSPGGGAKRPPPSLPLVKDVDLKQTKFYQEVFSEGRQEGEAAMLLLLIENKFGPPDDAVRERIESADADTLLRWSARVLTTGSVEEVLSG